MCVVFLGSFAFSLIPIGGAGNLTMIHWQCNEYVDLYDSVLLFSL